MTDTVGWARAHEHRRSGGEPESRAASLERETPGARS